MPSSSQSRPRRLATELLAETPPTQASTPDDLARVAENAFASVPRARMIPIERIAPSGDNPRKSFDRIDELADSIAVSGILQPLLVRRDAMKPGYYKLIAGERRLQAAHRVQGFENPEVRARIEALPCIIRDENDQDAFADSLAENVARNDLTRAEIMDAYRRLRDEYGWGVRAIARRTGRSVGDVSELLNLGDDPRLAPIVRDEVIAPTTASEIRRLPPDLREKAIEGVRTGTITKMADVQRLRRSAEKSKEAAPAPTHLDHKASKFTTAEHTAADTIPEQKTGEVFNIEHPAQVPGFSSATSTLLLNTNHSGANPWDKASDGVPSNIDVSQLVGNPDAIAQALNDAWAAGLFEGEGNISHSDDAREHGWQVTLISTQEDVIRRFGEHIGLGKVSRSPNHQEDEQHWGWKLTQPDGIRLFYRRIAPWLGQRRKAKFAEALNDLARQGS